MGHKGYAVFALQGGGDSDASRTATYALTHHQFTHAFGLWERRRTVDVLATVVGDIDVSGSEFAQTVDGTPQAVDAVPLKRRQHLKGEGRRRVFDKV